MDRGKRHLLPGAPLPRFLGFTRRNTSGLGLVTSSLDAEDLGTTRAGRG